MGKDEIIGGIIAFIACFMCAVPFIIISVYDKDSKEPINFWSGDKTLKSKVKNIQEYNKEMAALYKKCAIAFIIAGIGCMIHLLIGVFMICFNCTFGIYITYRCYKNILSKYS